MGEVDGRRGQGTGKEEEGETGWYVKKMRKINLKRKKEKVLERMTISLQVLSTRLLSIYH